MLGFRGYDMNLEALMETGLKPMESGAPGGIRTPNLMIRSHVLYPVELRVQQSYIDGTSGQTRTGMFLQTIDFESTASTIPPQRQLSVK